MMPNFWRPIWKSVKVKQKILELIFAQKYNKNLNIDAEMILLIQDRRNFPDFFKIVLTWQ